MNHPFKIKICGVTSVDDAKMVAATSADAIGLNFYSTGKRYVDPVSARAIVDVLSASAKDIVTVGVFVDSAIDEMINIAESLALDVVQLHGDQCPEDLVSLKSLADGRGLGCDFIRAIRTQPSSGVSVMDGASVNAEIDSWVAAGADGILVDAAVAGSFGGTGKQVDWAGFAALDSAVPKILAGGLTPDNIAQAISTASPWAVDVASGVEHSAGVKNESKTRTFADSAIAAFGVDAR